MCHMSPCFRGETRAAPIDKRNLFLLSRRVVFRCRHKSFKLTEKNNFQILIICKSKLSKAERYKSNVIKKITDCNFTISLHFKTFHIFSSTFLVMSVHFHYFTFCLKLKFPIADIIVNRLYILFLRSLKTNIKCYSKKRKKSVATNIDAC